MAPRPAQGSYADLDVLVVSSDDEGTPVSAIEAMASGCPIVATRVGGLPDLIEDGEVGHLVPARDAEAMSGAILGLLRDGDRARRMGQSARALVRARYRAERLCRDIEALYTELLAPRRDLRVTGSARPWDFALKRVFDVTLATAGLVGSAPLWGLAPSPSSSTRADRSSFGRSAGASTAGACECSSSGP